MKFSYSLLRHKPFFQGAGLLLALSLTPCLDLQAQQSPLTVNGATTPPTLTLIANPNPSYTNPGVGTTYYSNAATYTITLNPTAALSIGSTTGPIFTVGDGTTGNNSDFNNLTTNGNLTLTYGGGTNNSTVVINGIIAGTNGGTISNTTFGTALQVTGTLGINSTTPFTNNGTISGADGNAITATTIGYLVNSASGTITGGIGSQSSGTITFLSNAGHINAGGSLAAIQADSLTTLINTNTISGGHEGIYVTGNSGPLGTLTNSGSITGSVDGIELLGAGTVTQITNHGTISGGSQSGIQSNENIADVENYGNITGGNSGNGIGAAGGTGVTTLNNYTGAVISGFNGVNGSIGTLTNNGTLEGIGGDGLTGNTYGSITNTGTIEGQEGIHATTITSLTNSGTITGNGGAFFNGIDAGTIQSLMMSGGSITGGLYGIKTNDGATLVFSGGTVSGGTAALFVNALTDNVLSSVTINGRATIGGSMIENTGTGTLTLNLIGLTPASRATLQTMVGHSSGAFTDNLGDTYDWSGFVLQGIGGGGSGGGGAGGGGSPSTVTGYLTPFVDSGLQPLASSIDGNGLPAGPQYTTFVNAAAVNPEAAVQSLSGRVIDEGFQDIKVNINNGLINQLDSQLDNILGGPLSGAMDFSNLNIGSDQMIAFTETSNQLSGLVQAAAISDVAGTELTIPPARTDSHRWGVWADGTVSFASEDQRGAQSGYHALYGTPTIGLSYRIDPSLTVGALANYTTAGANFSDGSEIDVDSEIGGAFATWQQDAWRVHALAAGGVSQYKNTRATLDGSTASSSPDGSDVITDATGGYEFNLGQGFKLTPQLGVQYTHIHKDDTSETGSDLGLNVGSQDIDSLRSHLGFNLTRDFQMGDKLQFIPEFRAAWYHEYLDDNSSVNTSLQTAPALGSFAVTSVNSPERDYALLGVGLNTAFTGYGLPIGLFVDYDVQVGQASYIQHNVSAGVRVAF